MHAFIFCICATVSSFTHVDSKTRRNLTFELSNKSDGLIGMLRGAPIYEKCYCGIRNRQNVRNKIIGGRQASEGEFPWMGALYYIIKHQGSVHHRYLCGVTLMSSATVVTAAHCMNKSNKPQDYVVTLGTLKTTNGIGYPPNGIMCYVRRIIQHPHFTGRIPFDFDFAVLRLTIHVDFNYYPNIRPACYPHARLSFENMYGDVCGWGTTKFGRKYETYLRTVNVKIYGHSTCVQYYGASVGANSFCAGDMPNGGKDSCTGDSGGPLTSEVNGKCYLAGVVSSGFSCGVRNKPGIYMNVRSKKTTLFIDSFDNFIF